MQQLNSTQARVFIALVVIAAVGLLWSNLAWPGHPILAQMNTDYDADDDGLIEVGSLAQLDAIRYDLDGDGSPTNSTAYDAAFPNAATGMGCPSTGCTGYELTSNLDFDTNGDGRTDIAGDDYWNSGAGWEPISDSARSGFLSAMFRATLEGNSHVISGLFIDRSGERYVGFFGRVWGGEIRNLGLESVVVKGDRYTGGLVGHTTSSSSYPSLISASYVTGSVSGGRSVGGLVGSNQASIDASYAAVSVTGASVIGGLVGSNLSIGLSSGLISASYATGSVTGGSLAGGLVGNNQAGSITASYAKGSVSGKSNVGGLVGSNHTSGSISASYATGSVTGAAGYGGLGGLVGSNDLGSTITASYWDTQTSGLSTSDGGVGKTTSELQSPTDYSGIYADWNVDLDGDGTGDDPWSFGASSEYPNLKGVGPVSLVDMDKSALVTLYNATDGANWTNNTNWLSEEPLGDWHGVTTDDEGRVTRLRLSSNNLVGTIPAELGNLSNLTSLSLGRNDLTGAIPSQLGNLSNLETLWLGDNQLTGAIPAELGSLSNLDYLGIEGNGLTDAIPSELGNLSSLTWLALNGNQLTGALPQSFTNLTALDDFAFNDNAGLCAPTDAAFQTWLQGISNSNMATEVAVPFGPNCVSSEPTDYDADDDGLIEVDSLAQLDAIRYDLNGNGTPASANASDYSTAFPNAATGMGCPSTGCTGYELTTNLDFDTNGDGSTDVAGDDYWNNGAGWQPIVDSSRSGYQDATFHATFEGNSHVITGLYIDRSGTSNVGLFGQVWGGEIRNLGLEGMVVKGGDNFTGGLVGSISSAASNDSLISGSYVSGSVSGESSVGGLAGFSSNEATINASYAAVSVSGTSNAGGLVGTNHSSASISASYATGSVTGGAGYGGGLVGSNQGGSITASYATGSLSGSFMGGLVGNDSGGTVTASYWDTETTGRTTSAGGVGKTTSELQSPTGYTGIYSDWNVDLDGDGIGDDPWNFGTSSQYPVLKGPSSELTDRDILIALYNATDGDNWTNNTKWLNDEPLGDWHGVTTDTEGRVTELRLSRNQLSGSIPPELGGLSKLEYLALTGNQLSGSIPSDLGNLSNLTGLAIAGTLLSGPIPPELGSLLNLGRLYLGGNQLSGSIPPELGVLSNLMELDLARNQLTGPVPGELGNLAKLMDLHLYNNELTSPLPQSFTRLTLLEVFTFSNNGGLCAPTDAVFQNWLKGIDNTRGHAGVAPLGPNCADLTDREILVALYNATDGANWEDSRNWLSDRSIGTWEGVSTDANGRVTGINLFGNDLTGVIPAELGSLSNLEYLTLQSNRLTGAIPAELGNLTNLKSLALGSNDLTGAIPAQLGSLSNLTGLHIWGNDLTGAIPAELGNLSNLMALTLNSNRLTGAIPSELDKLSNLTQLWLGSNNLTGAIPTQLGSLSNLRSLKLDNNDLAGAIPTQLGNLSSLTELNLVNNQLTGCIPAGLRTVVNHDLDELDLPFCDVLLSGLTVSPGFLAPTFDPNWTDYSASVGLSPVTVTVIPTNDQNATFQYLDDNDLVLVDADSALEGFQVEFGGRVPKVKIRVVSQDTQATHTYVVTDLGHRYDADANGSIEKVEAILGINDYLDHLITKREAIELINLYLDS